jgi:hypothetical protein
MIFSENRYPLFGIMLCSSRSRGRNEMEAVIGIAILLAIWIIIIWGSSYFNKNVR